MEGVLEKIQKAKDNNCKELDLPHIKISNLPATIGYLTNLQYLYSNDNQIINLPAEIGGLTNLQELYLYNNQLSNIPAEIGCLTNLQYLYLDNNQLSNIPAEIGCLTNLKKLFLFKNQLSNLPIELMQCRQLTHINYENNPIEIHPLIGRWINRMRTVHRAVYNDEQSVHNHNIQESVRTSIMNLFNDEVTMSTDDLNKAIVSDDVLDKVTKESLIEYCNDTTEHSLLHITFRDLLLQVWNRIINHKESKELKRILNSEMYESICKCYTGRMTRLVNVLNGFYDDIKVEIGTNEQIGNIVVIVKEKLESTGNYSILRHKELVKLELEERGYDSGTIEEWLIAIE